MRPERAAVPAVRVAWTAEEIVDLQDTIVRAARSESKLRHGWPEECHDGGPDIVGNMHRSGIVCKNNVGPCDDRAIIIP